MHAALRIVKPPACEPVDIDAVRKHCRVDSDYDDDMLSMYAVTARSMAEHYLDRALITQELSWTIVPSAPPIVTPAIPHSFYLLWPGFITHPLALPRARTQCLKAVRWGEITELRPIPRDMFVANLSTEPATIAVAAEVIPRIPSHALQFEMVAGYGDKPDDVPLQIRHAILMMTAWLYENRGDVPADNPPQAMWNVLTPYRLWSFSG